MKDQQQRIAFLNLKVVYLHNTERTQFIKTKYVLSVEHRPSVKKRGVSLKKWTLYCVLQLLCNQWCNERLQENYITVNLWCI